MPIINSTTSGVVLSDPVKQNPETVVNGATVTNIYNDAAHQYGDAIYGTNATAWTISNYGTIQSNPTAGDGIELAAGGIVNNAAASSQITGYVDGIDIGGAGTVTNLGTIAATDPSAGAGVTFGTSGSGIGTLLNSGQITSPNIGVSFDAGGYVSNASTGIISGGLDGVEVNNGAGTIVNYGTIAGGGLYGVVLRAGGYVTNARGGVITGRYFAVDVAGAAGTVVNLGNLIATGPGAGGDTGVLLQAGGYVSNASTGLIGAASTFDAVVVNGAAGTIVNYGTITGGNLGVWEEAGGTVTNYGSISATDPGTGDGVTFGNGGSGVGTLFNYGQITAPNLAVWLDAGGYVRNGLGGVISGGSDGVLVSTNAGTVVNHGMIDPGGGNGVYLSAGGSVVNRRLDGPALIEGYDGVRIAGPSGTLLNDSTIASTGTGFGAQAVDFLAPGTVFNYGTILGTNTDASGINAGFADVTIINGSTLDGSATIAGYLNGIDQFSSSGIVINFATISSSNGDAVYLQAGGTVHNYGTVGGLISGRDHGVHVGGSAGTVFNTGTVEAGVSSGAAVYMRYGGLVDNGLGGYPNALIAGGTGVRMGGGGETAAGPGTVRNAGTILGTYANGVFLGAGGLVDNQVGAQITGYYIGVQITGGTGTLVNDGSIAATGTFKATGIVFNTDGLLTNDSTVTAVGGTTGTGISLHIGTLSNAAGAVVSGSGAGVYGNGSIVNGGTIAGYAGIDSSDGGFAYNSAGGQIVGDRFGVIIGGAPGTVINHGSILASGSYYPTAIYLGSGGTVDNFGLVANTVPGIGTGINFGHGGDLTNEAGGTISGGSIGVIAGGTGSSITNLGTILGGIDGVDLKATGASLTNSGVILGGTGGNGTALYLYAGGSATNASSGLIQGYHGIVSTHTAANVVNLGIVIGTASYGARFDVTGSTLRNAGTIATDISTDAVHFNGGGNRLIVDPGAVFVGADAAYAGGGGDVPELASAAGTGTIGGLGSQYVGFEDVTVDAGASWVLSGSNTLVAGGTLFDFGTLTNTGSLLGSGAQLIVDPATFVNSGYVNTTVTLAGDSTLDNTSTGTIAVTGTAVLGLNSPNTVVNAGTIVGNSGVGIDLLAGGFVTNAGTGIIQGSGYGIDVAAGVATIVNDGMVHATGGRSFGILLASGGTIENSGTITGDGSARYSGGIRMLGGGTVVNSAGALVAGANYDGVEGASNTDFVTNFGTVTSSLRGVVLFAGGTVINGAPTLTSALISATAVRNTTGVDTGYGSAYVLNWGTVIGGSGVFGRSGLTTVNHGLISGRTRGVYLAGSGVSAVNTGTIVASSGYGVLSTVGGFISNASTGIITGSSSGVVVRAAAGTVFNTGSIVDTGPSGAGVALDFGGFVSNDSGALITGGGGGVEVFGSAGTVSNLGTITGTQGDGVRLFAGGTVVNGAVGVTTAAIGSVYNGIESDGTTALVENYGTISGTGTTGGGVYLTAGGSVINNSGGVILGTVQGVAVGHGVGTVVNSGTIEGTGTFSGGIYLTSGGLVANASNGLISGPTDGVEIGHTAGTVDNLGTIVSTAAGSNAVYLGAGGSVINGSVLSTTALVAGFSGVNIAGTDAATIDNFGTIVGTGGTAISLGSGADLVILEAGSVLSGAIAGFVPGDTLDLPTVPFSPGDTVAFDGTTLTVSGGGESQSVALAGIAAETDFILESDAQGGAELGPVASGSNLVVSSGQVLTVLAGQSVSNVTVESGGVFDVASGGVASAAVIQSGGLENVFSGGTDSGATVSSGGFEDVFGNAVATLVLNGGSQTVEAGGTASAVVLDGTGLQTVSGFAGGTVVGSGDEELVTSGGVASGTVISEGGSEVVLSGGLTSDTTIAGGTLELQSGALASGLVDFAGSGGVLQLDSLTGPAAAVAGLLTGDTLDFRALPFAGSDTVTFDGTTLTVSGGGVSESVSLSGLAASTVFLLRSDGSGGSDLGLVPASGAVVSAGEVLHISAGETLSGVTVLSGGVLEVDSGGTALGTMVSSGGEELVLSGGTDSGAVISSGGFEDVFGSASASLVLNGGSQTVEAGGSVTGAVLDGVGLQTVSGVAIGTVVSAGDEQLVASGGVASGTTVLSGGLLVVAAGGVASGAVIASGGDEVVSSGGVDRGAVVSGGGVEEVFGNGRGTVVLSGGEQLVEPGGNASGTVISQGGREEVLGGVTSDTRIAGGELEVTTGAAAAGVIDFGGVVGTLRLESLATPGATLEGVAAGDVIDLPLLSFATSDTATLGQNELLTVSGGGQSVSLQFDASVAGKGFALSDDGSGGTLVTLTAQVPQASLFDFVFIYNGGQDYYLGRVADDGRFGVAVGETKTNAAGSYIIFGEESGASSAAAGSVFVDYYSHGGPGASSGVPVKTAAGSADGNAGLGSESDTLVGLDGAGHAFSSTQPAAFATTALFGFVFTYADGAAYSGTVADNTPGGLPGSRTVTDASGNVLGVYTIFRDGVTSRPAGSVVIDRFVANGIAVLANHASNTAVDGRNGLGSEVGSVTVGSVDHAFGPRAEPVVTGNAPTEPASSTPPLSDVIANEVDRIFADILGRFPTQGEFDTAGGELGQGTSPGDLRAALAGGSEASGDVAGLYRQVFGRAATTGEIAGATGALANGGSLAGLQQQLANSAEASGDINQVYRDILGRDADPSGLASFVAALGDETPGHLTDPGGLAGLAGVRDVLAHSGQAEDALTSLFQTIIGRAPSTAERAGMEDRLVAAGTTEATLKSALRATGSAGGFTTITAPGGNASLAAPSGPSLFQFSDIAFNDTITGFDARRDTIQLPKTVAADFPTVQGDTTAAGGGSLITLNQNQSIFLAGLPPAKLAAGNFLLL